MLKCWLIGKDSSYLAVGVKKCHISLNRSQAVWRSDKAALMTALFLKETLVKKRSKSPAKEKLVFMVIDIAEKLNFKQTNRS